jgi:hypothetical protein
MQTGRIEMYLLSEEMKNLINANTKIFPVNYNYVSSGTNPNNYEYVRITDDTGHKHEIYIWEHGWKLIGADDKNVSWNDIPDKPASYPPSTHNHDEVYSKLGHTHNYAPSVHTHTESQITDLDKYTQSETDTLLAGKATLDHNHDGRYYQKSEVETKLTGKSDNTHTHAELHSHSNKTVIDKLTQTHIDSLDNGLSSGHTHGNLSTLEKMTYSGANTSVDLIGVDQAASHATDGTIHVTQAEKDKWNNTEGFSGDYNDLNNKPIIPTATSQLTNDSGYVTDVSGKADKTYVDSELSKKADSSTLSGHSGNTTIHVTQTDKDNWNGKAPKVFPVGEGMTFDTEGLANGRFFTLNGVPNWVGWTLNASFSAQGWNLDDTSVPGWFLKLDVRNNLVEYAVYKIPAGSNPHTDEYPVFQVKGSDDETYLRGNKALHTGNFMSVGATQPTTELWYKVVG